MSSNDHKLQDLFIKHMCIHYTSRVHPIYSRFFFKPCDLLNNAELTRLMSDLDKAGEPDKCPHGRPTRMLFSLYALEKDV